MQAFQYLFIGTGTAIAAFGVWRLMTMPRLYAAHVAEVALREQITGEVVGYEQDSEDNTYTRLIEYEVDGHRYRMRGAEPVREQGKLNVPARVAFKRDLRSDAIDVECDFSGDELLAKIAIATGVVFVLAGVLG